ncbi:MAG: hypothetical protein J6B28_01940 [Eubacterium sp.]|nr:hypothetical protein [Eubacterium sp.]
MQKKNDLIQLWKNKWKKGMLLLPAALVMLTASGCSSEVIEDVMVALDTDRTHDEATCVSSDRYVHETLDEKQQLIYDEMLQAIMNMKTDVRLSTTDVEDVKTCYRAICADYGEIFWLENGTYEQMLWNDMKCAVHFKAEYAYTPEKVEEYKKEMQPVIDEYVERLEQCDSDYEKTEVLYRKLIKEVAYDMSAENNQNILSVFLGKETVCQGYACATQYLLHQVGVPCAIVTGEADGEPHAWNLAELDGDYYYIDVTWGNAQFSGEGAEIASGLDYSYLNVTGEELERTHQSQVTFPLPTCDQKELNYFVKKGRYIDAWDADTVGTMIRDYHKKGKESIALKFADRALLEEAKHYLLDEEHILDYCEDLNEIYYVIDTDMNIFRVYF